MAKRKSKFRGKTTANAKKQKAQGSQYGYLSLPKGTKLFKEEPASRVKLDLLPYIVTDPKHPDRDDELEIAVEGGEWYKRPFKIHRNVGADNETVVCPLTHRRKCPIDEYRTGLLEGTKDTPAKEWDDPEVKACKHSDRNLYVVVPKDHKDYDEKPYVWDISQYLFQDKLNDELEEDEDYGDFPDLKEGLTLKIRFSKEKLGKNEFADTSRIDFEERDEPYNENIMKKVPNLDEMIPAMSYEALHAKFFELEDESESTEAVVPPDEEKDDTEQDTCVACRGIGENSKGNECRTCKGTGKKAENKESESKPEHKTETKEATAGKCPNGYSFATDCEEHDECDGCDDWEACMDAKEETAGTGYAEK